MALSETTAKENNGLQSGGDPAVTKLQSRWKNAVKKASAQTGAEVSSAPFDASDSMESAFVYASEFVPLYEETPAQHAPRSGGVDTAQPRSWHTLRPSQLRKVDRELARMQQAWLAPPISGHFILNDHTVEWQLALPQPIVNPVVVEIGYQPMVVDERASSPNDEISPRDQVIKPTGFSLSFGAESFLLNWIPVSWQTLSVDAKHALLLVALTPLVEALGLALGDHWNIAALNAVPVGAVAPAPDEAAKISIGVAFRRAGVEQVDTATLSVPEVWLERFLAQRHDASRFFSMKSLLAAYPHVADMQYTLPVILGELSLDVQSVRGLEVGDVIFFATHYGSLADIWHSFDLKARIDAPSAIIDLSLDSSEHAASVRGVSPRPLRHRASYFLDRDAAAASHFSFSRELHQKPMENTSTPDLASSDAATVADHLATLPIAITIEVGELSMPLSALSDIKIGTTLALAKPLDEHMLTIRANGHAIAFGELVMLDNEVGVRVKRLSSPSSPPADRVDEHLHSAHHEPAFTPSNLAEGELGSSA